ncbi:uncharacterized protein LOC108097055 [Drosophila ficusphila]|uniref:uncharacterized protein LOC108097055 n=1 Tax=Drosophila ficusphila TaxID=30025 RepID=UPI0007E61756|nr:uncharacterized protein LOC108097055 [Drosophila ficusphila]
MERKVSQFSRGQESYGEPPKLGLLARLDRLLRRWLPGYSYIRGKRRSPSGTSVEIRAPFRGQRGREAREEVYLDTGIAKSEFCVQLEALLRKKHIKRQQELALEQRKRNHVKKRELDDPLQG